MLSLFDPTSSILAAWGIAIAAPATSIFFPLLFSQLIRISKEKRKIENSKRYLMEREITQLKESISIDETKKDQLLQELNELKASNGLLREKINRCRLENKKANMLCDLLDYLGASGSNELRHKINAALRSRF